MTERNLKLKKLEELLLLMAGILESMLKDTAIALIQSDGALARKTIARDSQIDQLEKEIDEEAIQTLVLHQPAAKDLRFVASAMKICTDLERMGDISVNICERISELSALPRLKAYEDLPRMMTLVSEMISTAIDSFIQESLESASKVLRSDDEIDDLFREIYLELLALMQKDPSTAERGLKLIFIAKHLERMADHATNIAEQVVYQIKGLDIRHLEMPAPVP